LLGAGDGVHIFVQLRL